MSALTPLQAVNYAAFSVRLAESSWRLDSSWMCVAEAVPGKRILILPFSRVIEFSRAISQHPVQPSAASGLSSSGGMCEQSGICP